MKLGWDGVRLRSPVSAFQQLRALMDGGGRRSLEEEMASRQLEGQVSCLLPFSWRSLVCSAKGLRWLVLGCQLVTAENHLGKRS